MRNIKKIIKIIKNLSKIDIILETKLRSECLLNRNLTLKSSIITDDNFISDEKVLISLTTYSKRVHDVYLVIESIAMQSVKANKIILWLDENEFTIDTIPITLKNLISRGLVIKFCENFKSYKKLVPSIQEHSDYNIVTIDDDIIYPHDMLEQLLLDHISHPNVIISHRAHKIKYNTKGEILDYDLWDYETKCSDADYDIFPVGVGGILYPPHSLSLECVNYSVFMDIAPHADDVWFKAMSLKNNVKCKKVNDSRAFYQRFLMLENNQDIALGLNNVINKENDTQLKKVFKKYNLENFNDFF